ncbi:3-oxoacyl-ACP synthase [Clostridiaceae bacterium HSG29]|nr:3-oxoacyl-ACP synthase [Clostridiaceae bacterium HSG29]
METIGIVGTGIYIPENRMSAKEIAEKTNGNWTEENIIKKLGILEKPIPSLKDGTQEMGALAALDALKNTGIDPKSIDLIISIGEEWKEYPLTTTAIYIQDRIGAINAWGIDFQQRCATTISAMKIAKDMMSSDKSINTVMIAGGYRNGDFVDYKDPQMSMMYNLSAGGGAIILKKGWNKNLLLGSHIMTDGSMALDAGVVYGGTTNPITSDNLDEAYTSLKLMNSEHMKSRLNDVSMPNWLLCIDKALEKSECSRKDIDYLGVLHFKRSMHEYLLNELELKDNQTIYLQEYGHMGQVDQILSLHLANERGLLEGKKTVALIAAGIGYAWAAGIIRWG